MGCEFREEVEDCVEGVLPSGSVVVSEGRVVIDRVAHACRGLGEQQDVTPCTTSKGSRPEIHLPCSELLLPGKMNRFTANFLVRVFFDGDSLVVIDHHLVVSD